MTIKHFEKNDYIALDFVGGEYTRRALFVGELDRDDIRAALDQAARLLSVEHIAFGVPIYQTIGMSYREAVEDGRPWLLCNGENLPLYYVNGERSPHETQFERWMETFIDEKGIDTEQTIEVEGPSGLNVIPVGSLVETIKAAPKRERDGIKTMLVKIDFHNASVLDYFRHLAQAVAV